MNGVKVLKICLCVTQHRQYTDILKKSDCYRVLKTLHFFAGKKKVSAQHAAPAAGSGALWRQKAGAVGIAACGRSSDAVQQQWSRSHVRERAQASERRRKPDRINRQREQSERRQINRFRAQAALTKRATK